METPLSPSTSEPKTHPAETLFLKYRHFIFIILIASLSVGVYLMLTPPTTTLAQDAEAIHTAETSEDINEAETSQIVVDIAGAVQTPGVYFLDSESIVEDAVSAAGGFSKTADLDAIAKTINRAERIEAHSKIYIPKRGDNLDTLVSTSISSRSNQTVSTSKININTATATELDILPGVGPVTAQRIIDHRLENGDYQAIEDIKNVPGISDGKFEQLKNLITVN